MDPRSPYIKLLQAAIHAAGSELFADENPQDGTADWSCEANEDVVYAAAVAFVAQRRGPVHVLTQEVPGEKRVLAAWHDHDSAVLAAQQMDDPESNYEVTVVPLDPKGLATLNVIP